MDGVGVAVAIGGGSVMVGAQVGVALGGGGTVSLVGATPGTPEVGSVGLIV